MLSNLRPRLASGPCLGVSCRMARTPDIAHMLRDTGYSWMFLDFEHGPLSFDQLSQMALAGVEAGVTPLVRLPDAGEAAIHRVLSNGAMGIIIPHVNDPETAAFVARQCRFPPHGTRSVPGILPQLGYAPTTFAEAADKLNPATLCVVMIESPEALDAIDEIASVDGVDVLFVGASDLSFTLGTPSEYGHPGMVSAMEKVAEAARRHGKHCGFGGVSDPVIAQRYIAMGHRLILAGNDQTMFLQGARARHAALTGG